MPRRPHAALLHEEGHANRRKAHASRGHQDGLSRSTSSRNLEKHVHSLGHLRQAERGSRLIMLLYA
eukprot:2978757-Amphidinium_carterae.3